MRPPESLELRLERVKYLCGARDELLKRQDDRRSIVERYSGGELSIHMHIDFAPVGQSCAIYVPAAYLSEGAHRAALPLDVSYNRRHYYGPLPVLVGIRDVPEPGQPTELRSLVWLAPLNRCDVFDPDSFEKSADILGPEIFAILDRKLRASLFNLGVEQGQIEDEIIKSRAKVVDSLPDENPQHGWHSGEIPGRFYEQLVRLNLETKCNLLILGIPEGLSPAFDVRQVFSCARYPKVGSMEEWVRACHGGEGRL